jgi:hypothetical protein
MFDNIWEIFYNLYSSKVNIVFAFYDQSTCFFLEMFTDEERSFPFRNVNILAVRVVPNKRLPDCSK